MTTIRPDHTRDASGADGGDDSASASVRGDVREPLLLRLPGVYPAQGDTWLLARALAATALARGSRVLDLGTGSGALAVVAARLGAAGVTAVDVSLQAVVTAWLNARCRGLPVRVLRGDMCDGVRGDRFDVILANPPYLPAGHPGLPRRGARRAWDAGLDGRVVLDRVCREAPPLLAGDGTLLLVHSALCGVDATLAALTEAGLRAELVQRRRQPFGPRLSERARMLEARGLIRPGQRYEELVVIRGTRAS